MKFFLKNIYIILFSLAATLSSTYALAKNSEAHYNKDNISNYFLGIVSVNNASEKKVFNYLNRVKLLKDKHTKFNIEFVRNLILLEKFNEAVSFSKKIWKKDELFFEADLILGLDYFIKKDYKNSKKHFKRLNKISEYNFYFQDFMGNVLLAWNEAAQGNQKESLEFLKEVPKPYRHIIKTQQTFIKCYFDTETTEIYFEKLISDEKYNFSRYNFFLVNYLLHKNKNSEAKEIIKISREKHNSNLLLKETENLLLKSKNKKIKNFFNCRSSNDVVAEFFYLIANLYSSERDYQLSNFYLKISLLFNEKFLSNKALLAENYYFQKKNLMSKKYYNSIKSIGAAYSWYASKNISRILLDEKDKKYSVDFLKKEFDLISRRDFEHYYDLGNFYKENEYYEESIKYYSLALKNINEDHYLIPKILDRRGTSYERIGNWEKAEIDLKKSLEILPEQAHVLNYLAYTWIDKGINLEKGLKMLEKAAELKKEDGYIIDSLGWAHYAKENYIEAKFFLQKAVELLPLDPIINDHYADALWMLNKDIQARYVWKYILSLSDTEQKLKDSINKKLIFGISKKS